jgi:hypothetical protein
MSLRTRRVRQGCADASGTQVALALLSIALVLALLVLAAWRVR